jgi:enoyl-CoA hydratase/carnithine racemase
MSDDLLQRREEDVVWLTMNRPDRLNALSSSLAHMLADALTQIAADESVRVVVLGGAGRAFCAGLDIIDHASGGDRSGVDRFSEIVLAIRNMPQTVVASVRGPAVGGGFAFALAADLRIAGESARFKNGFIDIGVSGCELGASQLLPRAVGAALAAELMLTGRALTAERALTVGFVTDVVPDDELPAATARLVGELTAKSPIGLRRTKETIARLAHETNLATVISAELEVQHECMEHPDHVAALERFITRRS